MRKDITVIACAGLLSLAAGCSTPKHDYIPEEFREDPEIYEPQKPIKKEDLIVRNSDNLRIYKTKEMIGMS